MKEVPLDKGKVALVDDVDYERVMTGRWYARLHRNTWYAESKRGKMHRFILGLCKADPAVDHANGNGLDNRRSNLRLADASQNASNRHHKVGSSSRFKGVCWHKRIRKWQAGIRHHGRRINLGYFDNEDDAARAYASAAADLFGAFAAPLVERGR